MQDSLKEKIKSWSLKHKSKILVVLCITFLIVATLAINQALYLRDHGWKTVYPGNVTCEEYGLETVMKVNESFSWCSGNNYVWGGAPEDDPVKNRNQFEIGVNLSNATN